MVQDLRLAVRQLSRSPGFAAVVVITLSLGIGATTALFTMVNEVLLRPLDYPDPERIVTLWSYDARTGRRWRASGPDARDWAEQTRSFSHVARYRFGGTEGVVVGGSAENIEVAAVSGSFFDVLGVAPRAGRRFDAEELRSGVGVLVGDGIVRRFFGGDPTRALGAPLETFGRTFRIVGVMPPGFAFPGRAEVWLPVDTVIAPARARSAHNYFVLARLAPDVPLAQAEAELDALSQHLAQLYPDSNRNKGVKALRLHQVLVGDYQTTLWLLLGAAGLVLLIACANIANILLARGTRRAHELAVRAALGAGHGRLARQLLTESLVLALLGGAAGLLVAHLSLDAVVALAPRRIPRLEHVTLDRGALLFTAAVALIVCLGIGLAPVLQASRLDIERILKASGRSVTGPRGRARSALVIAQVAISMILLTGAGLLAQSLRRLTDIDPGYRTDSLLVLEANYPGSTPDHAGRAWAFFQELGRRAAGLPGVSAVSFADSLPVGWVNSNGAYWIEGRHQPGQGNTGTNALFRAVGPDYFAALGVSVRSGREIDRRDTAQAPRVVVINQSMARASWPGASPIGQRIKLGWFNSTVEEWMTIVGVVEDLRQVSLDRPVGPELYVAVAQHPLAALSLSLVARTSGDPLALADSVRSLARHLDPKVPVKVTTAERQVADTLVAPRFRTFLVGLFAALALVLALVGVAGVMACVVAERRNEIGLRIAVGARAGDIALQFLLRALRLSLAGIVLGFAGALAGSRVLQGLLFEVSPTDIRILAAVSALLVLATLVASAVPALRAASTSPMTALRAE